MLPFEVTESGVLIIHLRADLDIAGRAAAAWEIDGSLAAHRSAPVVLELSDGPVSDAAVSTVVRAHRMCRYADVPLGVVAADPETRRSLAAAAVEGALDVHDGRSQAVAALSTPVAVAA
ncbi:STAS domain-containing protein [Streptomyces sp. NPDC088762]|uniref:STAS domain-containing protein n=1 Tax=Streptomyces sp. NPDC088762 TaxID=3365891 RepID=UPI00382F2FCE